MKNKVQHIFSAMALTLVLSYTANAQTTAQKIGKNPTTIASSAVLDIDSDHKGVLFPRVALVSTTDATAPIVAPATGLVIYNTATAGTAPNNVTPGYYFWNGTKWARFSAGDQASKWTNDAANTLVYLTNFSDFTARTAAKKFSVHDNNILQIGDMTDVAGASHINKSIVTRKNGDNSTSNTSDGGIFSSVDNLIYGGTVPGSAAYFTMTKYRGSLASPAIVQDGDLIGSLDFRGGTGTGANWINGARLVTNVDGAVTTTSIPMWFDFQTITPSETSLTSKLRIKSNGNVGVGTTSPSAKLDVNGTGLFRNGNVSNSYTNNQILFGWNGTNTYQHAIKTRHDGTGTSRNAIDFFTWNQSVDAPTAVGTKQVMTLYGNGNVGIGTTEPANKLEITQGTAGNSGLRFTNLNASSAATTTSNKVLGLNSTGDVILTNVPGTQNIVEFAVNANPNTAGTTFDPNTPTDQSVVYQSAIDNSLWTYNGTTYVTYTAPASTAWNLANSTNDAGSNKTANIWRSGSVGIGTNNPATNLHIQNSTPAIQAANADAKVLRLSRPTSPSAKWDNIAQFNLGTYSNTVGSPIDAKSRLDLALTNGGDNTTLSNVMTWQANGNVGVGTTAPNAPLVVQGASGTGLFKLIAPSGSAGDNWWMGFGHGPTSTDANDRARIGVEILGGGAGRLFFTTGNAASQTRAMFIDENQRVGIGTTTPTSRLEVDGAATNKTAFNAAAGTTIDFSKSNLAYTTANPGNTFTLNNLKDGGTYTLAVQGTTAGTASFTASGFTFKSPNNGLTAASKETIYTFMVMGSKVYFYMTTGI